MAEPGGGRRLAAIVATDVAEYSGLMEADGCAGDLTVHVISLCLQLRLTRLHLLSDQVRSVDAIVHDVTPHCPVKVCPAVTVRSWVRFMRIVFGGMAPVAEFARFS